MKVYLSLYRWAMRMKLHMAMYTFVAIFLKILYNLLYGIESILISDLLSMWITCLLFAVLEFSLLSLAWVVSSLFLSGL